MSLVWTRFFSVILLVGLFAWGTRVDGSSIVVTTLKSTPTCCGEGIGIGDPNVRLQHAVRFVPTGDFLLEAITFDLVSAFGSGPITAQIYGESGGLPGTLLYSATANGPAPADGGLHTIPTPLPFTVLTGQAYWLTGINTDPASQAYWWYSDQIGWRAALDIPGRPSSGFPDWGNANGGGPAGPGTNLSAILSFEITGAEVPEPSGAQMGFAGLTVIVVLMALPRWRMRKTQVLRF